jgi:DNA-binding transcriptional ArsR family regulator
METVAATVDLLRLFGDPTRLRLAHLLARTELTVAEITQITQLPQSRVSTHLGKLRDAGVLRDRRDGSLAYYVMNDGKMPPGVHKLWALLGRDLRLCCARGKAPPIGPKPWPDKWNGTTHQAAPGKPPPSEYWD